MKPIIYALRVPDKLTSTDISVLLLAADRVAADKFISYGDMKQAYISLAASALARIAVGKVLGVSAEKVLIERSENGKPYVVNYPDIFFSVSHSHNVAVCAVSDREIGIDIEFIAETYPKRVAARFFNKSDVDLIAAAPENEKSLTFYKLWTQKESMVKCTGEGIAGIRSADKSRFMTESGIILENFAMSVCSFTN